jgi:hypothetical protein
LSESGCYSKIAGVAKPLPVLKGNAMKKILTTLIAVLLTAGCNLPSNTPTQSPDVAYTAAAQTVEAALTQMAPPPTALPSPTAVVPPTPIPIPTNTTVPSPTAVPIPCNRAAFVTDVSFPDGTPVSAGSTFTKTWRLTNAGTCTWTSGYQLVFHQGDAMGVPTGYAQSLTSGTVAPGATVDISVNLVAPTTPGSYKGYWRLREPGGQYFGLGNANGDFWVAITAGAAGTTITLTPVAAESGTVRSDAVVNTVELIPGDSSANAGLQLFLSYDITTIPTTATITEVKLDLTNNTVNGNPFSTLGCLKIYPVTYAALVAGLYFIGTPAIGADHDWCNAAGLATIVADNDYKAGVQSRLGTGRVQFRLQFLTPTDGNSTVDAVNFTSPKLTITYKKP